jgi:hypothetical protein
VTQQGLEPGQGLFLSFHSALGACEEKGEVGGYISLLSRPTGELEKKCSMVW